MLFEFEMITDKANIFNMSMIIKKIFINIYPNLKEKRRWIAEKMFYFQ